jgi:hypothetical protein
LLFANGCVGAGSHSQEKPTLKVRLLWQGVQCVTTRPDAHAVWIENPDQFKKIFGRITRYNTGEDRDLSSRVDFSREGVLIVAMGQKPTGGYELGLNRESAVLSGDTAVLTLSWIEPAEGAILPQIITNPCLVIKLQKGPYSQIRLLDQDSRLRLQLRIN